MAGFNPNTINLKAGMDVSGIATSVQKMQRHLGTIDKSVNTMRKSFNTLGFAIAGAFSTAVIGRGIESAIKNASDLNETISKTGEIFGESTRQIVIFAKTAAETLGLSSQEAMDAASNFAIFGKSAGLSGRELVSFSTNLVKLSADLASFYNTSPQEAIVAIGAALRGESEPIRKYGVLLNDATLKQIAFDNGIRDTIKGSLTPQEKILAANIAIVQQTSVAQGDFERTADGAANATRKLTAQVKDLSAELGVVLLPALVKSLQFLNKHIKRISDGWTIMTTLISNNWKVMVNRINIQWSALVQSILKGIRTFMAPGLGVAKFLGFDFADDAKKNLDDIINQYDIHIKKLSKRKWKTRSEVAGAFFSSQDMVFPDVGGGVGGTTTTTPTTTTDSDLTDKEKEAMRKALAKKNEHAIEEHKNFNASLLAALKKEPNPVALAFAESLGKPESIGYIREATFKLKEDIMDLTGEVNAMIEQYVFNTMFDVFERIGAGLFGAAQDVDNWGNKMLASFGGFLSQMGKMIIAYGVSMDAFKKAFKNPVAAIAAGAALIVIGSGIKSLHESKMGAGSAGSYGGVPAQSGGMGYNFETRIDGYDLVLVNDRNQRLRNRRG